MTTQQDLKVILKPLIKEAVKACLLESGILSSLIKEVLVGVQGHLIIEGQQTIPKVVENKIKTPVRTLSLDEQRRRDEVKQELNKEKQQAAQKMMKATGMEKMFANLPVDEEVFIPQAKQVIVEDMEDVISKEPLTKEEEEELLMEQKRHKEEQRANKKLGAPDGGYALKGIPANDPGVNIQGILAIAGGASKWKRKLGK